MNSISRYIEDMEYDNNLKKAWTHYNKELDEINKKIESFTKPELNELYKKKTEILAKIKVYEGECK